MSNSRKKSQPNQNAFPANTTRLEKKEEKPPRIRGAKTEHLTGEYSVPKPEVQPSSHNFTATTSIPSSHSVFDAPLENAESRPNNRRKKSTHETQNSAPAQSESKEENAKTGSNFNSAKHAEPTGTSATLASSATVSASALPTSLPIVSLSYSFIYFIRLLDNTKSDESTYKIGYSNDVPAYRKQLETNMPQNVKTMRVLHCKKGDADKISAELCNSIKSRELRSSWFRIKKEELDNIIDTLVSKHQCEVVSESKAVIKTPKKSRKPSN